VIMDNISNHLQHFILPVWWVHHLGIPTHSVPQEMAGKALKVLKTRNAPALLAWDLMPLAGKNIELWCQQIICW
jgi:hypothetical protein